MEGFQYEGGKAEDPEEQIFQFESKGRRKSMSRPEAIKQEEFSLTQERVIPFCSIQSIN